MSESEIRRGLAVIERFLEESRRLGLEHLAHDQLLLVRAAEGLSWRLRFLLQVNLPPDESIISPADLGILSDLAKLLPEEKTILLDLRDVLAAYA